MKDASAKLLGESKKSTGRTVATSEDVQARTPSQSHSSALLRSRGADVAAAATRRSRRIAVRLLLLLLLLLLVWVD